MPLYHDPDQSRTTPTLLPVGVVYPSLAAQSDFGLEDFQMTKPILSADSHITEPPDTYTSRIGKNHKDQASHRVRHDPMSDPYVTDGMDAPVPMGLVAAAGKPPEEITIGGVNFEDLHPGDCEVAERILPRAHLRHVPR